MPALALARLGRAVHPLANLFETQMPLPQQFSYFHDAPPLFASESYRVGSWRFYVAFTLGGAASAQSRDPARRRAGAILRHARAAGSPVEAALAGPAVHPRGARC